MSRLIRSIAVSSFVVVASAASAGEFRVTPVEARVLEFLDRDGDGSLARDEFERFPVPMRRWLADSSTTYAGQPVPVDEFAPTLRSMLDDLRAGQYSDGIARRPVEAVAVTPEGPRPVAPKSKASWVSNARYVYGQMDRNRDGKLDRREWEESRTLRPWFEAEGIAFSDEMSRDEFVEHLVDLQRRLEEGSEAEAE